MICISFANPKFSEDITIKSCGMHGILVSRNAFSKQKRFTSLIHANLIGCIAMKIALYCMFTIFFNVCIHKTIAHHIVIQ